MFILSLLFDPSALKLSMSPFTLLSPGNKSLLLLGGTGTIPVIRLDRWWTLVSANYLHGSLLHILFNMVVFRRLATLVFPEYGTYRTLAIYTFSGIIGFGVSLAAGVPFTIGASAAVFGLIGAALYYGKSRGGVYGQSIYKQIGGLAIGLFIFGLLAKGVNNWAHGGGMVGGAVFGYLLGYRERAMESLSHRILGSACAISTILILIWAIITGIYYRFLG
jgi:rhomboid protease GluP